MKEVLTAPPSGPTHGRRSRTANARGHRRVVLDALVMSLMFLVVVVVVVTVAGVTAFMDVGLPAFRFNPSSPLHLSTVLGVLFVLSALLFLWGRRLPIRAVEGPSAPSDERGLTQGADGVRHRAEGRHGSMNPTYSE